MNLPQEISDKLNEMDEDFKSLFNSTYKTIEKLGLKFHIQNSPNVIAVHPKNGVNFVALWIKGRENNRRIEGEVRVDGFQIEVLSTGMKDELILHKYDRDKKPIWWITCIESQEDIDRLCLLAKRVMAKFPDWS